MLKKIVTCGLLTTGLTLGGTFAANAAEMPEDVDRAELAAAIFLAVGEEGLTVETADGDIELIDKEDFDQLSEDEELLEAAIDALDPEIAAVVLSDEPTDPVEPVDPVDPVEPIDPVDPIDPVEPVEPVKPVPPVVPEPTPNPKPGPVAPAPAPSPAPVPQPTHAGDWGATAPVVYGNSGYAGIGDQLAFTGGAGIAGIVTASLAALSAGGFLFTRGRKPKIEL